MNTLIEFSEIKQGETVAFEQLVETYKDKVLNTCFGFLNNREDAEDVTQDVFIEVYGSLASFRHEAKLSTWIYRIAVTKSLDLIRKRNRKKRFDRLKQVLGLDNILENLPDQNLLNPEEQLMVEERKQILYNAIEQLAENQKIAITLSKIDGFANKEIAEIMGTSLVTVESLIHRAKKNLHQKLFAYYEKRI